MLDELYATSGAILMGRRMFDVGVEPWGDPPPFHMPVFVVTHEAGEPMPMKGGTTYTFVSSGIEDALEQAKAAAGEKNVALCAGWRVLDIACGPGLVSEAPPQRVAPPIGLDVAPAMVERARLRCPDLEFVESDAQQLPFRAQHSTPPR